MQKTAAKNTKYSRNETILKIGHLAKPIEIAKWSVWVKKSNGQKRAKNDSTSTLELFCAKNRCKKHQIFEKWDHFENRPSWKGYRFCKMVSLGQKFKWPKTCEKIFYKHVRVVLWKNRCIKHQIFEKWDHFENRQSWKGYRLCKMVSLGQKLKWPKTCEKRFCKHVRVVLCKKLLQKTPYSRKETILKIGHLAKAIDFATWSVWLKNSNGQKRVKKDSTSTLELFCAKNRWKKHHIFEKWDHFENRPSCKGYRLCKMVSLAQKFKWPKTCEKRFYKHVRVVLCKKALEKTPNIREMRPFWKSAILQRV